MELETTRLKLQEITLGDLEILHELYSIPDVDEFNTMGIPKNIEATREMIKPMIEAQKKNPRSAYHWKILLKETGELIGEAGFFLSNDKYRLGEIYYKFLPKYWGAGFATETAKALINLGFNQFNLHKVEAGVATENVNSVRVLEKIGMVREGLRRKILPIRGEWKDNYHYAIVEDDPRDY